jgi:hypothetical protein
MWWFVYVFWSPLLGPKPGEGAKVCTAVERIVPVKAEKGSSSSRLWDGSRSVRNRTAVTLVTV